MEHYQIIEIGISVPTDLVIIGGALFAIRSWLHRPRLLIGVPPSDKEMDRKGITKRERGRTSYSDRFRFKPDCLAISDRFWFRKKTWLAKDEFFKKEQKEYEKLLFCNEPRYAKCCRTIKLDKRKQAKLPLLVANNGHRTAREYILGVDFRDPGVHVVDVATESLRVASLYVTKPEFVNDHIKNLVDRDKIARQDIVDAYDTLGFEKEGSGDSDILFVTGNLERGVYEIVLITVQIDQAEVNNKSKEFVIVYKMDCSDWGVSAQTYFQGFRISKGG